METGVFCQLIQSSEGKFRSRVLIVSDVSDLKTLQNQYGSEFEVVPFSQFVSSDCFVPMPERAFSQFAEHRSVLRSKGKAVIVIGLDGYLSILDDAQIDHALSYVCTYLDGCGVESVVFVFRQKWAAMERVFRHPSLVANNIFVQVGLAEPVAAFSKVRIALINDKFAKRVNPDFESLRDYLKKMETWAQPHEGEIRIAVQFNGGQMFGGLSRHVAQYPSLKELFKTYCDFHADFSDVAFQWVVENTHGMDVTGELRDHFYPNGTADVRSNVLLRYRSIANSGEREVFLSVLASLVPKDSYVAKVLRVSNGSEDQYLERYINVPEDLLAAENAQKLAEERAEAIRRIKIECPEVRSCVAALIDKTKNRTASIMKPWLRIGLDIEETEWIRRALDGEPSERVDAAEQSELLGAYLFAVWEDCNPQLAEYFSAYREEKCADRVTPEFCERAFKCSIPEEIPSRASLLAALKNDSDTALLVVDAVSAEYIPFLVDRAKRHQIKPVCVNCAIAKLPTSTPFNPVKDEWENDRYLKYDEFDKALHENYSSSAEALARELRILDRDVMVKVSELLARYRRVVLTADHGASRLAVLARKAGFSCDLTAPDGKLDVCDWRFAKRLSPQHLDSDDFVEPLNSDYVVVKGYNRFSRSGAPGYEIHGGATIEECVVPVMVFERAAPGADIALESETRPNTAQTAPVADAQIGENQEFDI